MGTHPTSSPLSQSWDSSVPCRTPSPRLLGVIDPQLPTGCPSPSHLLYWVAWLPPPCSGTSWDHLPNKLLTLKFSFQGRFLGDPNPRWISQNQIPWYPASGHSPLASGKLESLHFGAWVHSGSTCPDAGKLPVALLWDVPQVPCLLSPGLYLHSECCSVFRFLSVGTLHCLVALWIEEGAWLLWHLEARPDLGMEGRWQQSLGHVCWNLSSFP